MNFKIILFNNQEVNGAVMQLPKTVLIALLLTSLVLGSGFGQMPRAYAATGDVLASGTPFSGNGRALAFDGTHLYATYTASLSTIHKITVPGLVDVGTISVVTSAGAPVDCGALSWDGSMLWCGTYDADGKVYKVDKTSGLATLQFDASPPVAGPCYSQSAGFLDGLEYNMFDSPNTLWISDDAGKTVYHFSAAGALLGSFSAPCAVIAGVTYECNAGINFDGAHLWLAIYGGANPDVSFPTGRIAQFTTAGVYTGISFVTGHLKEDIAYDAITFAPKCAIWALTNGLGPAGPGSIHAYEIPCSGEPSKVPEFGATVPLLTSLAAVVAVSARRLLGRREAA